MKDLLEKIRAKVIEANPEIESRVRWTKVDPQFDGTDKGVEERLPAPIRLADVLLAIEKFYQGGESKSVVATTHGGLQEIEWGGGYEAASWERSAAWNLREDDLEKQSEETLAFISKVLNV